MPVGVLHRAAGPALDARKSRRSTSTGEGTLLVTSAHEVWPGHFLHFLHANRNASKVGQLFQSYAYTEGWAHYTEEMM